MPRDDFRRELNDAFSRISGSPSTDLPVRVRSALIDAPDRRGPVWLAGVAAVAIAALVVGALFVIGPLRAHQTTSVPGGVGLHSPSPSPSASPTDNLPAFICGSATILPGVQPPQTALVDAVRTGTHTGYDRITIEFSNGQASRVEVTPQNNSTFTQGASGQTVQLQGADGILITIRGADEHTSYSGPGDFHVGPGILEARQVQDFEGVVQWGLGLAKPGCYRVFYLTNPDRLVIDVQTS